MLSDWVLIITAWYAIYMIVKESLWLKAFCKRWLYVYNNQKHSQQHLAMLVFLGVYLLLMNWITLYEGEHYIIAFIYNLLLVPITVNHIEMERLSNKENHERSN